MFCTLEPSYYAWDAIVFLSHFYACEVLMFCVLDGGGSPPEPRLIVLRGTKKGEQRQPSSRSERRLSGEAPLTINHLPSRLFLYILAKQI